MHRIVVLFLFLAWSTTLAGQENFVLKKDLRPDWQLYETDKYSPYTSEQSVHTIYFSIKPVHYKGDYLVLTATHTFSVWLNGKLLLDNRKNAVLPIDSLQDISGESLFFAVHGENKIDSDDLLTEIHSKILFTTRSEEHAFRKETSFRDFTVLVMLVLLIFLTGVVRLNPRLSSSYLSVTKMFSLRENEEDQFYYRLTSGNILFYVFTSMILACCLMIVGQFTEISFTTSREMASLLVWLKLTMIILFFLFAKMFVIYIMSSLFNVRDIAGYHTFNFIRVLMVLVGLLTLIVAGYYLLRGQHQGFYSFSYDILYWILGGWIVLLFFKLTNRIQYSVFHLFSYICATEILPLLLVTKVLNE